MAKIIREKKQFRSDLSLPFAEEEGTFGPFVLMDTSKFFAVLLFCSRSSNDGDDDQCYKTNFAIIKLPKNYGKISMHYVTHKMSLHLEICTIKMKMT